MTVNLYKVSILYHDNPVHVEVFGTSEQTDFTSQIYDRLGIDKSLKKFDASKIKITGVKFEKKLGL